MSSVVEVNTAYKPRYNVSQFLDMRNLRKGNGREFRVSWEGLPPRKPTWEREIHLKQLVSEETLDAAIKRIKDLESRKTRAKLARKVEEGGLPAGWAGSLSGVNLNRGFRGSVFGDGDEGAPVETQGQREEEPVNEFPMSDMTPLDPRWLDWAAGLSSGSEPTGGRRKKKKRTRKKRKKRSRGGRKTVKRRAGRRRSRGTRRRGGRISLPLPPALIRALVHPWDDGKTPKGSINDLMQ